MSRGLLRQINSSSRKGFSFRLSFAQDGPAILQYDLPRAMQSTKYPHARRM
jgi:hypothetical protein